MVSANLTDSKTTRAQLLKLEQLRQMTKHSGSNRLQIRYLLHITHSNSELWIPDSGDLTSWILISGYFPQDSDLLGSVLRVLIT